DYIDSVISFFNIDRIPSGSNDPFALRRQTSGIVRILIENELTFDWKTDIISILQTVYGIEDQERLVELQTALSQFVNDRLKAILNDQEVRYDIADAVLQSRSADILRKQHPQYHNELLGQDRKSTRLNSSHVSISYAVFCL